MKIAPWRWFAFSLILLLNSTRLLAVVTPAELVYQWRIGKYQPAGQQEIIPASNKEVFDFREDGTFSIRLETPSPLMEAGIWELKGDSLVLKLELLPVETSIDSLSYKAENNVAYLFFFFQGEEVARYDMTGLGSARRIETYHLSKDERGNLLLTGRQRSFMLIGRPDLLQAPFSFTDVIRALIGILSMLMLCWVFSTNRRAIDWRMVSIGIGLQVFFAVMVLKVGWVRVVFEGISGLFVDFLGYSKAGSMFLFGGLVSDFDTFGSIFAFQVLPTIVFFSAMMSILYYLGILQKVVYAFAWLMSRTMRLSGAESLAAAGNVFLGQTESPLLIRPYLAKMTRSEIMALMTGGMATIAGSVFVAYVDYLGGPDIEAKRLFATHLLTASIMSAPAALVAAKILVPETEPVIQDLDVPKERIGSNLLDAITNGTTDGLKLAVNVGVMLLVFTAIVALVNGFLSDLVGVNTGLNDWVAHFTDGRYREFNLQFILGLLLAPIAWLLGVPTDDIMIVGQLLGEKTIINEFFAYATLGTVKAEGTIIHFKSVIIATYALCGFANFASIGIQIGGIGALEPSQRKLLSELGVRSLIGGTVASFLTAAIAGMLSTV